ALAGRTAALEGALCLTIGTAPIQAPGVPVVALLVQGVHVAVATARVRTRAGDADPLHRGRSRAVRSIAGGCQGRGALSAHATLSAIAHVAVLTSVVIVAAGV